jgi:hypothetical protein
MKQHTLAALLTTMLATSAGAQPPPRNDPPAPPPPHLAVPPAEALAAISELTPAQQVELRKILIERRDALDNVRAKTRVEREALDRRERSEHDRVDEQTTQRLRAALGDEGYARYARWSAEHQGPAQRPPRPLDPAAPPT